MFSIMLSRDVFILTLLLRLRLGRNGLLKRDDGRTGGRGRSRVPAHQRRLGRRLAVVRRLGGQIEDLIELDVVGGAGDSSAAAALQVEVGKVPEEVTAAAAAFGGLLLLLLPVAAGIEKGSIIFSVF